MMRGLLLLLSLSLSGCASLPLMSKPDQPTPPDISGIVDVSSRAGVGHVCPVTSTEALTVEHVSTIRGFWDYWFRGKLAGLLLDIGGMPATAVELWADVRRDLSVVRLIEEDVRFPKWYAVAPEVPEAGESLWMRGFDHASGFKGRAVEAIIQNNTHGIIYLHLAPRDKHARVAGSSGSCLLDEQERIVGIVSHVYVFSTGSMNDPLVLVAGQLVAGPWGKVPDQYKEKGER